MRAPQDEPDDLHEYEGMSAAQKMTKGPLGTDPTAGGTIPLYINLHENGDSSWCVLKYWAAEVFTTCPDESKVPHPYSTMFGSPKTPSNRPPKKPAMPWV